jgi:hypothetical protein
MSVDEAERSRIERCVPSRRTTPTEGALVKMPLKLIPLLLTSGPLVLTVCAWARLYTQRRLGWPKPVAMAALGIASANATYAAFVYLYYSLKPSPWLPPWKDPETLDLGLLFLTAPTGIIVTIIAAARGAQKWLIVTLIIALATLSFVGLLEGSSV